VRLVFAGTPAVALPALDAIAASRHELVAVVTRPDAPAGRGRRLVRSPAGAWADERGIDVLTPARPREPEFLDRLRELAPDCVPVVAYGALVPPAALEIPRHGWVNLHFSLLPAWRGAAPVQHAVLDGIEDGTARAVPQPVDGVSLAPKITVEDAHVRWTDPAFAVDRRIRACTPVPGAWSTFREERVKLGPVRLIAGGPELEPGDLLVERSRVLVGTATTPVALGEVRAAGKKAMAATDWARGVRPQPGERLT
jgi:methionyl-tRNA formyltransferase